MGWAAHYIQKLKEGETVQFRPRGSSMLPYIKSGALVTVEPITDYGTVSVGDVVLCKIHGREFFHRVLAIRNGKQFQIGNAKGHVNGWCSPVAVYGRCVKVEA